MIWFNKVRWKNFLSTGNNFTEIDLKKNKTTLIIGQNGSGKSTMLDAISFGLFGKSHRNINKPQVVNSINNKDCVVEVEFTTSNNNYKVIRGLKPNIFEIWHDNKMISQSSNAKDYQKILEQNILKLNHKSFHQVVVLGSSSFIPFMQLTPQVRRQVIEEILDINIFSRMNNILKQEIGVLKEKIRDSTYHIDINKNKKLSQEKYIKEIQKITNDAIIKKQEQIEYKKEEKIHLEKDNANLINEIGQDLDSNEKELLSLQSKKTKFNQYDVVLKQKKSTIIKNIKFFQENDTCPTCSQEITDSLKNEKINDIKKEAKNVKINTEKLITSQESLNNKIISITETIRKAKEKQNIINSNIRLIEKINDDINLLNNEINNSDKIDLEKANKDLMEIQDSIINLEDSKKDYKTTLTYKYALSEMLKDTGIKTKIIKQYLPVMNNFINQYLDVLDFYAHFHIDESFNEIIKSRHRDEFTYESFSEGEKQRIDLALLFTWRQIAKMKNSISTNLLMLDETFDSSLDHEGIDNLLKILYTLDENTNTFVISHKEELLDDKFDNKIEFMKSKNFSHIKKV